MDWNTIQQFVRIVMGWIGLYLVGQGLASEEMANVLIGGLMGVAQFAWWFIWNSGKVILPSKP